jgi:hypothetical protein
MNLVLSAVTLTYMNVGEGRELGAVYSPMGQALVIG